MPATIPDRRRTSLARRLGWFALLYAASVGAVGLVAYGLRLWLKA